MTLSTIIIKSYLPERIAGAKERGTEFDKIIDVSLRTNKP
jgi:hypothetical protein